MIQFLIIPLILLLIIGIWLLIAPVIIEIDSAQDIYRIQYRSIGQVWMENAHGHLLVRFRVFGFKWKYDLTEFDLKKKNKHTPEEINPSVIKNKKHVPLKRIMAVIRSIEIRKFYIDLDTDDYVKNAILFPAGYLMQSKHAGIAINFNGYNRIQLLIVMVPVKLLWAYIGKGFSSS